MNEGATMQTIQETEYVGILRLGDEPQAGWCAFLIEEDRGVRDLIQEARDHIDGSYMPGDTDHIDNPPMVTIEVRRMPKGWVESLPEFTGW